MTAPATIDLNTAQPALAAELAVGLLPLPEILKRFDLTPAQLKALMRDPQFRQMVRQFKKDWEDASNSKERIRVKASLAVEENLLELHRLFRDIDMNPTARLEAFKQLVQLADVAPKKDAPDVGQRFSVTINIPGAAPVAVEAPARVIEHEGDSDA